MQRDNGGQVWTELMPTCPELPPPSASPSSTLVQVVRVGGGVESGRLSV